ncbi:hypothetical protein NHX12_032161 [Muraenolepis orangiensis]|uniref:Uncharacterized protein n=1 Tax=Muraenolepis orangiensis TaxID=630683 RepID=A0A9Q0E8V0_9TELE|nr:hypothetical protein NHX12_032161 [Muraenolepis orangiensis]
MFLLTKPEPETAANRRPSQEYHRQRNHQHDYQHSHLDLTALTPKMDRPQRGNNILTSATEPYDLSRSFQNLSPLPPSYELPPSKAALSKYWSSLHRLSRWSSVGLPSRREPTSSPVSLHAF